MSQSGLLPARAVGAAAELSRKLGIYRAARVVYRTIDPRVRARVAGECAFYRQFVPQGTLVFDIGANKGQKTEIFRLLGARVVAVEPNPRAVEVLGALVASDTNVEIVEAAMGAAPGRATLHAQGTASTASLREDWPFSLYDEWDEFDVSVETLDSLIARFGVPDFCKIDVEGFELDVLRGLGRPLPLLSFEFFVGERDRLEACLSHLEALGPIEVNAIEMEVHNLLFREWIPPRRFLAEIAATGVPLGDLFVRST